MASSDRTYVIPAALALMCVLLSGVSFAIAPYFVGKVEARHSWSSTSGVVVKSHPAKWERRDPKTGTYYGGTYQLVEYTYEVDGRAYVSDEHGFGDPTAHTPEFAAKHPVGAKVTVYYDPKDPSQAALFVGATISPTPFYVLGVGLLVLGLPFAYLAFRLFRGRRRST